MSGVDSRSNLEFAYVLSATRVPAWAETSLEET